MSDPCNGCLQKSIECDLEGYNTLMDECPCGSCLVKVTCSAICDLWFNFLEDYNEFLGEGYSEELKS